MSSAKPSKCRRWTPVQTSRPSGRPVGFFMIRIRGHGWPQNSLSSWGSGLHVFCHQVCTLIRDSLYYFEQRWWCPRFRGTFCSWCIPTFTACDLATQGSSSSGFWALCAPLLLKSLDVKKNTGSSRVIRSSQCRPYKRQSPFITLYNHLFKYRLRNRRTFQRIDKSVKIFWCINLIYLFGRAVGPTHCFGDMSFIFTDQTISTMRLPTSASRRIQPLASWSECQS